MHPALAHAPGLTKALGERPVLTLNGLLADEQAGHGRFVYPGPSSALFVRSVDYATGERVMEAGPAAGKLDDILAALPGIEDWARNTGHTQAHITAGRKGWERLLTPKGYEFYAIVLRKVLR